MVFTEDMFLFYFLPLILAIYYLIPYHKDPKPGQSRYWMRNLWLTIMGYVFYAWFEPWFVLPMMFTNVFDYCCGLYLGREGMSPRHRKLAVTISMISNLSLLAVFKYGVFTQENLNHLLATVGQPTFSVLQIAFPIGISFYTFHSMSYVIDVYRGEKPVRSFADFSAFVSLFPQLVAGPILRYNVLAGQLHSRTHSLSLFARGVLLFFVGFGMKILLANPVGKVADAVFAAQHPHALDAWWGVLAYAFQIYFDFNGYSVMALGLGMMFGFELIRNFNAPYHADSITDFWRRWHISLSTWLREYLYVPLGGNRKGESRTYINLALVMLLGGFWHGSQWQFIVWGAIHGTMLGIERWSGKKPFYAKLPHKARVAFTFFVVLITWVFFRADGLPHAFQYLGSMFGVSQPGPFADLLRAEVYRFHNILDMGICAIAIYQPIQSYEFGMRPTWGKATVAFGIFLFAVVMMYTQSFNPFLYFQF
jgi:alginate O-acetyltransferase complex protein AlgI